MAVRTAEAEWKGNLSAGRGTVSTETGSLTGSYSAASRFEEGEGTNPEELIAAAHAGCFSMALSHELAEAGFEPTSVRTTARVHLEMLDEGPSITKIELQCEARVDGIDDATFQEHAEGAKVGCPVSGALAGGPSIELSARLLT